jgi:NAD(P)H-dependent nitrite reductase small subunit
MERWIQVARADELAAGCSRAVEAGGRTLALFNDGGRYFALDDTCPHQGASLATGTLHEGRVICPLHAWVFDLRSGQCPRQTHEGVATYPTRCSNGVVEVQVPPLE